MTRMLVRCDWSLANPLETAYHDEEWGVPLTDAQALFGMLLLEGAQAGLSWDTILARREGYRRAFDDFDPERIARYDARKAAKLMADPGIIRNRLKIAAAIGNARAFLALREAGVDWVQFLWGFVGGRPLRNQRRSMSEVPAETAQSQAMSKALKTAGFRFVGPTICYAFMQATGMVNDHLISCFRHRACARLPGPGMVNRRRG